MKNEIIESPEVLPCIPSLQFKALNIKTYQMIVKIRGIM
jgi:hypothetical protein